MRLDNYLKEKYPQLSRSKIQDLIKRSLVIVNGKVVTKTGYKVNDNCEVNLLESFKYASRAGYKLEKAIDFFNISFINKQVLDIGSSTGGFTDVAIINGAKEVFAFDVGTNQMIDRLRNDKRVHLFENTNILSVKPPNVDLILIDVSFTSSKSVLKHIHLNSSEILLLIKPQFEVGTNYLKKGIVKDKKRVEIILNEFKLLSNSLGFNYLIKETSFPGKDGNLEYWLYLTK